MNKVLINIFVPTIEKGYDIYIPINKKIGTVKLYIIQTISEISDIDPSYLAHLKLYDKNTGEGFDSNTFVKDSNIRNGAKLLLL